MVAEQYRFHEWTGLHKLGIVRIIQEITGTLNKAGADLFLSYRVTPVLYRYVLSTVY